MRRAVAVIVVLALAGCGIDGPPSKPAASPGSGTQVTVSGEVSIGVVGSL